MVVVVKRCEEWVHGCYCSRCENDNATNRLGVLQLYQQRPFCLHHHGTTALEPHRNPRALTRTARRTPHRVGDVITHVNGRSIADKSRGDARQMLATAGDEFSLAIERAGEVQHLSSGMTQSGEGEVSRRPLGHVARVGVAAVWSW